MFVKADCMARCLLLYTWGYGTWIQWLRGVSQNVCLYSVLYLDQIKLYLMQPNLKYETFVSAGFTICTAYDSHCPCRPCQRTGEKLPTKCCTQTYQFVKICLPHSLTVCTRTEKLFHISGMWLDNSSFKQLCHLITLFKLFILLSETGSGVSRPSVCKASTSWL